MLRSKFERKTFKLLISGILQAMQGYKYDNLMYECITYYIYSSCFDPGIIIFKLYICGEAADDG